MKVEVRAYAKINLMLDITGKLENGYHSLFMLMQSVDLYDTVKVSLTDNGKITIICNKDGVPCDERNTAYKAAVAFYEKTGIVNNGVEIAISKQIPHEAGLAGGSADAAAVIIALNKLHGTNLSLPALFSIGKAVGSDVPFCILGGTCIVQAAGGVVSPVEPLKACHIVLCKPECNVSTPKAYGDYDNAPHIRHLDKEAMLHAADNGDFEMICSLCNNVFEQVVDVPQRASIKAVMRECSAIATCMSGSGPTVFGIFENEKDAQLCKDKLAEDFKDVFICKPSECGCEIVN